MQARFFVILAVVLGLCSCQHSKQQKLKENSQDFSNIIILVDLSDRNLANGTDSILDPNQILRDTAIISGILQVFDVNVKHNGYQFSKDKIQLFIAPQADNSPINFSPTIDVEKIAENGGIVRQVLPVEIQNFKSQVASIYTGHPKCTGADIWSFFQEMPSSLLLKGYDEKSPKEVLHYNFENKLIILTDGYMVFDKNIQTVREKNNTCMQVESLRGFPNWENNFPRYKLQSIIDKDFGNLEVMLLEINPIKPQTNTSETKIIETYWKTWFNEMKIKYSSMCLSNQDIQLILNSVKQFIDLKTK